MNRGPHLLQTVGFLAGPRSAEESSRRYQEARTQGPLGQESHICSQQTVTSKMGSNRPIPIAANSVHKARSRDAHRPLSGMSPPRAQSPRVNARTASPADASSYKARTPDQSPPGGGVNAQEAHSDPRPSMLDPPCPALHARPSMRYGLSTGRKDRGAPRRGAMNREHGSEFGDEALGGGVGGAARFERSALRSS